MHYPEKHYPHSNLTGAIIKCSQTVHTELGSGLSEKIYETALTIELAASNIHFSQQEQFDVFYRQKHVGKLIPDLVIADKVIVDTKVVEAFTPAHTAQVLSYLKITNLEVGLLINFKHSSLQVKRITNLHQSNTEQ